MKKTAAATFLLAGPFALLLAAVPAPAQAQAWVPPRGTGAVSLAVQRVDQTGHRLTDGSLVVNGRSLNVSIYVDAMYAATDRLVLSVSLPYVFGRYTDPQPPPPFFPFLPADQCRCWQSGAQDLGLTARYNLTNGPFALTPSVAVNVPSHDYPFQGESAVGRRLRELRFATDGGLRLDAISPRLSIQGQYAYTLVEQVLDVSTNRSNARFSTDFQIGRVMSAQGFLQWQHTHGGLRAGSPPPSGLLPPGDVNTPERLAEHDRLLRDNRLHGGGSLSLQLPRVDVFVSYIAFLRGTDTHAGRAVTAGVSWPFEWRPGNRVP